MNFTEIIGEFIINNVGCSYVIDEQTGKVVYADSLMKNMYEGINEGVVAADFLEWENEECTSAADEYVSFEQYDMTTKKFFLVRFIRKTIEGKSLKIVNLADVSDVMQLSREMASTGKFYRDMDRFKTMAMQKMSGPYYMLLPVAEQYVTGKGALYVRTFMGITEIYSYSSEDDTYKLRYCEGDKTENLEAYECVVSGRVANTEYALYRDLKTPMAEGIKDNKLLLDSLRLYMENSLMREEIVYESEHDKLTGLFNKGKYLSMYENEYKELKSIGILNFDVNYLKQTNDNYGHEAGDLLLKRAAQSIRNICVKDSIHGYRMGGDEYLCIIENPTKQEVDDLVAKWNEGIDAMNSINKDFPCIVAIGYVYGENGYDFDGLMHEADALMYEDKRRKKKPGEEIR